MTTMTASRPKKRGYEKAMTMTTSVNRGDPTRLLPDEVTRHMTGMLTMREFLQLRVASRNVHDNVVFGGEPMACLERLQPGLIARVRQQRGGRLRHLGLRLTFPPTADEVLVLGELRGMRDLKTLELQFEVDAVLEKQYFPDAIVDARMQAAIAVAGDALALGAETFSCTCEIMQSDNCNRQLYQLLSVCILANRKTLRHLIMPEARLSDSPELLSELAPVMYGLESLHNEEHISDVTNLVFMDDNAPPRRIETCVPSGLQPTWRYLNLIHGMTREEFVTECGSFPVPVCLPDTLEGLALVSSNIYWTCPPRLAFLEVLTNNCAHLLYSCVPPQHASLARLVLGIFPQGEPYAEPQHQQAYDAWLAQVSLPALESVYIYGNLGPRDFLDVARLLARVPHVKHIYFGPSYVHYYNQQLSDAERTIRLDMLEVGLPPGVHFERDMPKFDLSEQFLFEYGLSVTSPCTDPNVVVERGRPVKEDTNDADNTERVLQLQPALARRNQRRKAEA
jgi:hypothetical protein